MTILLFGATGMIGHGALQAALADARVTRVISVGRRPSGHKHAKLDELVHDDMMDLDPIVDDLAQADACLFCLGISSAGQSEETYRRITYDLTLSVAQALVARNPAMTFVYVSGAGTDAGSRTMWARVKGETEQALTALSFAAVYNARPGFIQPVGGATSRTALYRAIYAVLTPLVPLLRRIVPNAIVDTDELGRALVEAGLVGADTSVLEVPALQQLAKRGALHADAANP